MGLVLGSHRQCPCGGSRFGTRPDDWPPCRSAEWPWRTVENRRLDEKRDARSLSCPCPVGPSRSARPMRPAQWRHWSHNQSGCEIADFEGSYDCVDVDSPKEPGLYEIRLAHDGVWACAEDSCETGTSRRIYLEAEPFTVRVVERAIFWADENPA